MKIHSFLYPLFISLSLLVAPQVHAATYNLNTDSKATISTILELSVSQQGQSELRFGNITPSAIDVIETAPIHVLVEVTSNSGEPYLVTQTLNGPLQNADGVIMPEGSLKFTTSSSRSTGNAVKLPTAVTLASQIVFTSDNLGTSDLIDAAYTLVVPVEQAPGDYSTSLTYTVSAL